MRMNREFIILLLVFAITSFFGAILFHELIHIINGIVTDGKVYPLIFFGTATNNFLPCHSVFCVAKVGNVFDNFIDRFLGWFIFSMIFFIPYTISWGKVMFK